MNVLANVTRLLSGILMVGVGLLYLLYEESVLEQKSPDFNAQEKCMSWPISRIIIGIQVRVECSLHQNFSNNSTRSASYY
jgi:hypothetical protein